MSWLFTKTSALPNLIARVVFSHGGAEELRAGKCASAWFYVSWGNELYSHSQPLSAFKPRTRNHCLLSSTLSRIQYLSHCHPNLTITTCLALARSLAEKLV